MAAKDYYKTLNVKKEATEKEIRQAYRRQARKHHPDINPGDKDAESRFKEINAAYEVLSDPEKRKLYDRYGANWEQAQHFDGAQGDFGQQGSAPFDYAEFFAGSGGRRREAEPGFGSIFDRMFRGGTGARPRPRRGSDLEQPVEITLEEAFSGTTRTIALEGAEPCQVCNGAGSLANAPCYACGGEGRVRRTRRLEVRIPPGVKTGSRVRVAGEGAPGIAGGEKGDLYLMVSVRPHPRFERQNGDLRTEVAVPLVKAMLGGEVDVTTLRGRVVLNIPSETQNGRVFRLAGQGMPALGDTHRGDLYAKVSVVLPANLTEQERKLFEEIAALRP